MTSLLLSSVVALKCRAHFIAEHICASQQNSLDPDCWDLCNLVRLGGRSGPCVAIVREPNRSSYSDLFEPVMRIRLIVEGLDFKISALAIQRLRFFEGPVGLQPERAPAKFPCMRFQRFEDAPTDAEPARIGSDPHALDFANRSIFHFEGAATDGLTADAGDDEDAGGWRQFIRVCRDGLCRIEAGFEAAGQLAKILFDAPPRIGAVRRFRRYLNGGRAHQPLDLRHCSHQAIPLRDAERG